MFAGFCITFGFSCLFPVILFVGENDLLYKLMTDDVALGEVMNRNAFNARQYLGRFRKTLLFAERQVSLRDVTRDDRLGIEAETC